MTPDRPSEETRSIECAIGKRKTRCQATRYSRAGGSTQQCNNAARPDTDPPRCAMHALPVLP